MGIISRIAQATGFRRKAVGETASQMGMLPFLGGMPSSTGLHISQATAMAVSAVYACVSIRSQDVARCTPRLFKRDDAGKRVQVMPGEHPVARLLAVPNRAQTWFEFAEQMSTAQLLRGNAYAAVKRDGRGRPVELIPVNPDAVIVLEASDGSVLYNVNRIGLWQMAMLRDFPTVIAADDMLHIRGFSFNSLMGASTIGLARDAIGVAMGLEQQASRWMANGSRPSFLLKAKNKLSEIAARRLKDQWYSLTQGLNNTGATVVLEEGLEPQALSLTSVDLEFMAQRNFSITDVARFYRIPPHKLGSEVMRGINVVQVDQDYVNNTVMPDLHRWEQKFEAYFDLTDDGLEIDMDETVLLRADITSRYNAARIGLMSGFLTVNEVRAGEGLAPVDGGDEVLRPLNMAAAGSHAAGVAPDGAGRPEAGTIPSNGTDGAEPASAALN